METQNHKGWFYIFKNVIYGNKILFMLVFIKYIFYKLKKVFKLIWIIIIIIIIPVAHDVYLPRGHALASYLDSMACCGWWSFEHFRLLLHFSMTKSDYMWTINDVINRKQVILVSIFRSIPNHIPFKYRCPNYYCVGIRYANLSFYCERVHSYLSQWTWTFNTTLDVDGNIVHWHQLIS